MSKNSKPDPVELPTAEDLIANLDIRVAMLERQRKTILDWASALSKFDEENRAAELYAMAGIWSKAVGHRKEESRKLQDHPSIYMPLVPEKR